MKGDGARGSLWQLGRLIPCLLIALGVVDLGFRFVSIDPLTFRAWEALRRYRPPGAAFEPNRRYYNARSYGDLAAVGNLRELRQYRTEVFTTDALGFRNAAHVLDAEVGAILVGDSFAVGSGVRDEETLSSSLSRLWGCVVYNVGSEIPGVGPDQIPAIARRLSMRSRLVIRLHAEDAQEPTISTSWQVTVRKLVAWAPGEVRTVVARLRGMLAVSPLQILSERAVKTLADGTILPNNYADNVVRATLTNGESMLFLASRVNDFYSRREAAAGYWRWLQAELQKARFDLLVILVPGKYRVYRPLLVDSRSVGEGAGDYLDRLEHELRASGIPVLNLTPLLTAEAARALERGEYLYWLDDIHWNARAIALAAAAVRAQLPPAAASCRAPRPQLVQRP